MPETSGANRPRSVMLEELTREEARTAGSDGLVVLPLGATEQHGPHLPLGTDTLHVSHVAREAALRVADRLTVAVAPALPYGCSPHHLPFGGTASLTSETFARVVRELAGSLADSGCRRIFLVNGHGGNHELVQVAARDVSLGHSVDVGVGSWWAIAGSRLAPTAEATRVPGHAGAFETAVVLSLRPDLVRRPPARPDLVTDAWQRPGRTFRHEGSGLLAAIDGFTDDPSAGIAEHGSAWVEAGVEALADALLDFFAATGGRPTG